jgi:hypothetical protein
MRALASDPVLNIFASPKEPFITSNSGMGMLIQDGSFPGLLIASASSAHNARGKLKDDLDGFLEEVSGTLESLRRLVELMQLQHEAGAYRRVSSRSGRRGGADRHPTGRR